MEITWRVINRGVGGERGGKVQRISSINDRWKIDRGRVEVGKGGGTAWGGVEGWGENAENCN